MQMFEWRSSAPNPIVVNVAGPIAGTTMRPDGRASARASPRPARSPATVVLIDDGMPALGLRTAASRSSVPRRRQDRADRPRQLQLPVKVQNAQNARRAGGDRRQQRAGPRHRHGRRRPADPRSRPCMITLDDGNLVQGEPAGQRHDLRTAPAAHPTRDSDLDARRHRRTSTGTASPTASPAAAATVSCLEQRRADGRGLERLLRARPDRAARPTRPSPPAASART